MAWLSPSDQKALVNFLRELVQIPSPSGQEGALAQRLAEEMERLGFPEVKVDKVGNVIGKIGSGNRPIILFDGHMDTVEVADYSSWTRDPYGGEIDGRLLYGLGASDMKGGLASMVYGLAALIKAGAKIPGTVYFVGVVQEEPSEGHRPQGFPPGRRDNARLCHNRGAFFPPDNPGAQRPNGDNRHYKGEGLPCLCPRAGPKRHIRRFQDNLRHRAYVFSVPERCLPWKGLGRSYLDKKRIPKPQCSPANLLLLR